MMIGSGNGGGNDMILCYRHAYQRNFSLEKFVRLVLDQA